MNNKINNKKNKKPLRILILTYIFSDVRFGGEAKIVYEFSRALARKGVKVFVVSNYINIKSPVLEKNLKVYKVPFCGGEKISFNQVDMLKSFFFSLPILFLKKIDAIHLMPAIGPCPFFRFKIRPLVVSLDVPWDYTNPKYGEDLQYDRSKKFEETNLSKDKFFFEKVINKLTNWFYIIFKLKKEYPDSVNLYASRATVLIKKLKLKNHPSDFAYIPGGVNPKIFHSQIKPFKKSKDNFTFLFVGSIGKRKGVEYLIKAFLKLNHKYKDIELILVGSSALSTLEYFKQLSNSNHNIKFIGNILPEKVPEYLVYADVFILPSLGEPFGLVNLEAMACGKPIISTNAGGVPDYLKNGQGGFLVEPADVDDLAQAMEKFLINPQLAIEMGIEAKKYVLENLTWDKVAQKMVKEYQKILDKNQ